MKCNFVWQFFFLYFCFFLLKCTSSFSRRRPLDWRESSSWKKSLKRALVTLNRSFLNFYSFSDYFLIFWRWKRGRMHIIYFFEQYFVFSIKINRTDRIFSCLFSFFHSQTHQTLHVVHISFSLCMHCHSNATVSFTSELKVDDQWKQLFVLRASAVSS